MLKTAEEFNAATVGRFPGLIGFNATEAEDGRVVARITVQPTLLAPNGYLHAGSVVTLADTACGLGTRTTLPEGASGFATIELKSNHLGTAREGTVEVVATMAHGGRTTQVWDAVATHVETGKTIALFRCTQAILWK